MEQRLRTSCPCLDALWRRVFGSEKTSDEPVRHDGGAADSEQEQGAGPAEQKPPDSGAMFRALWSFQGRNPEELSFSQGELFCVVVREGDWWRARKIDVNGQIIGTGLVPGNYLERAETLEMEPWYFGMMNRFDAQSHLLGNGNEDGAFLVRRSDKDNIGYVLSVRTKSQVKHFKIIQNEDKHFQVNPSNHFESLMDLVEHYTKNNICNISRLRRPCRRKKSQKTEEDFADERWELPKDEFTVGEKLGSGYFADVHKGRWKEHINVAIKIIKNDTEMNHEEFQREVQMLKRLRHRHLISLFAVCTESAPFYIITELMEKGSLLNFLRSSEGQQQDIMSIIDMGAQVADGMAYLEEHNSIHRDLAARNVLVGEDLICKVADFGLARVIKEPFYVTEERKIPFKWSAPEAISHGKFSVKSDVWSFGVLLYELITYGGIPYPAFTNQETYQQVIKGYRMPRPENCPNFLHQIMLQCWSAEPGARPDFRNVKTDLDNSYEMELEGQSTYCSSKKSDGQR
ncbi:protein-tyrosine kinase 6-like [Synchiropus picturatus]